jgi:hypothetical protein
LTPGLYFLEWQIPVGFQPTLANVTNGGLISSQATIIPAVRNGSGYVGSNNFQVNAGLNITTINAGFIASTGSVSTFVWNDSNGNGIKDAGEPGLPAGVTVQLVPVSGNPNPTVTLTANSNTPGEYDAIGVPIGQYKLQWSLPSGDTITLLNQGSQQNFNSNAIITGAPSGFAISNSILTVTAGGTVSNVNAGFIPLGATVISTAWNDTNGNGIYDSNESGNSNVTAALVYDGGQSGTPTITSTSSNGVTTFTVSGITPTATDMFHIVWTLPGGATFTTKNVGGVPQYYSNASLVNSTIQSDSFTLQNGKLNYTIPQYGNQPAVNVNQAITGVNVGVDVIDRLTIDDAKCGALRKIC